MSDDKKLGDINVSLGDGNTVGHIGHNIYAPTPELIEEPERDVIENEDGSLVTLIVISAPHSVPRARFVVTGENVVSLDIAQAPKEGQGVYVSSKSNVYKRRIERGFEESFGPLHGKYLVKVRTKDASAFALSHEILPP